MRLNVINKNNLEFSYIILNINNAKNFLIFIIKINFW